MTMTTNAAPILPAFAATEGRPTTLGVLGGGQLGMMFVQVAQAMGYRTAVLDPDANSPAGLISHHHILAAFDDAQALATMGRLCDAITTEFENVPAASLDILAQTTPVSPPAHAVGIAQDRLAEKAHFLQSAGQPTVDGKGLVSAAGVGPVPYAALVEHADLASIDPSLFPAILKTVRMGYDGKGQITVTNQGDLERAWESLYKAPCVVEKRLDLEAEISVIVARGHDGVCVHLPVQRNTHVDGILARTEVFAGNVDAALANRAQQAAIAIARDLAYVGVLCVEFFVVKTDTGLDLVVNEMAPRPHNSGHYSLEACDVSQFALQVRTMTRLPLVQPRLHSPTVMLNLMGEVWLNTGELRIPVWDEVLALPGTHLHLYGKLEARAGRKMGHITVTAVSIEQARDVASQVQAILGLWH
jgi:5-(carboxyamino)imidazole ribonucleotide synthase